MPETDNDQLTPGASNDPASDKTTANKNGKSDFVASLPAGSLIGTDWSKSPTLELRESHVNAVRALLRKLMQRDMPARREEILRVWEAELFWRGYQHLLPSRVGFGWEFAGPGSGYGPGEQGFKSNFETNFYLTYGLSVVSALTRQVPKTLFNPVCPKDDADITAACAANKLRDVIIRNNNFLSLMSDMARFLWTDGRVSFYTRYVKDGQRFGFGKPEEAENPEEASASEAGNAPPPKKSSGRGEPRGQTIVTCHGALEVKYPIKANNQSEAGWLIWACERDLPVAKGMYPKKADKIVVSRGGPAGDDVDRLARVNTKLGVEDNFVTSDSEAYDVTIQNAWLRDCSLLEIEDDQVRNDLLEMSEGRGLRFTFCGNEFIEAKQESMDDHWTLCFALPGDGIHRPALGSSYIPVQKQANTYLELRNDYLVRGVPMKWMDNDMFDVEHIKDQTNIPGGIRPFVADPTRPVGDFIYAETAVQYPTGLEEAIEDFGRGQTAQIITGVFPALSGDDVGQVGETMGGLKLQRDAALGRIGIPWRYIKEAIANVMLNAVQCTAINHDENIYASGSRNGADPIVVELQDLKGKYYCEPSTDENFPESWSEIQNRVGELMLESQANPALLEVVNHPNNYGFLKKATGLTELYIPKQESYEKQLGEIEELKKSGPLPNPAYAELEKQIAAATQAVGSQDPTLAPIATQQLEVLKKQLAQTPQQISSVEVDEKVDDHETEALTCLAFLRGPSGRALKAGTTAGEDGEVGEQEAYENIRLHYLTHQQYADKIAAANKKQPEKGVSKSVSAKDLMAAGMTNELAQLLGEAGIQSNGMPTQQAA
jgi:hypothetical protein